METNYTTDNRWSPGSSGATVPEAAPAAYSARWIDMGDHALADILPDRQGFAYNDKADMERLITLMGEAGDSLRIPGPMERDITASIVLSGMDGWQCRQRRAGGYIYVDAWLTPPAPVVVEVPMVITELPERTWEVWCQDGAIRHDQNFWTLAEAREWADTGHACAKAHTFVEVWVPAATVVTETITRNPPEVRS